MVEIIEAKPNNDGHVIVHIHKQPYDVTSKLQNGKAKMNIYGKDYEVRVNNQGKDINGVSKALRSKETRK